MAARELVILRSLIVSETDALIEHLNTLSLDESVRKALLSFQRRISETTSAYFFHVPRDIFKLISSFCTLETKAALATTCKRFNSLLDVPSLYKKESLKLWEEARKADLPGNRRWLDRDSTWLEAIVDKIPNLQWVWIYHCLRVIKYPLPQFSLFEKEKQMVLGRYFVGARLLDESSQSLCIDFNGDANFGRGYLDWMESCGYIYLPGDDSEGVTKDGITFSHSIGGEIRLC